MPQDPRTLPPERQPRAWKAQLMVNVLLLCAGFGAGQIVHVAGKTGVFEPEVEAPRIVKTDCQTIVSGGKEVGALLTVELDRVGACALQRDRAASWLWLETPGVAANQFQYLLLPEESGLQEAPPRFLDRVWLCTRMLTRSDVYKIEEVELK